MGFVTKKARRERLEKILKMTNAHKKDLDKALVTQVSKDRPDILGRQDIKLDYTELGEGNE